ncbi:MAG: tRNA pseudouridine(38-40) synthase TruA [Betaproteobacteria bacterium]|nr:tRNA pseudouridine(38-40) synthase TruA [Betaproteobacteria bacterium]
MRIALGLEYDGAPFCGWQSQPSACGVQDQVERAVGQFLASGVRVEVTCAGRTDTGVHALEQVVHLDTGIERDEMAWARGVNRFLPAAIRVLWMREVPDTFHARFSAKSRTYRYLLLVDRTEPALLQGKAGWFHVPLDAHAMREAAALLVGEHDFSSFRSSECQAKSPVKAMHAVTIETRAPFIMFTFHANAFLHHMVRNLVGALVYVGAGRLSGEGLGEVLAARDRSLAPPTFSPAGLYLAGIEYDAAFALPQRASRAPFPI